MKTKRSLTNSLNNLVLFREYIKTCGYELVVMQGCANPWFNQDGLHAIIKGDNPIEQVTVDFTTTFSRNDLISAKWHIRLSWNDLDNQEILKNRVKFLQK